LTLTAYLAVAIKDTKDHAASLHTAHTEVPSNELHVMSKGAHIPSPFVMTNKDCNLALVFCACAKCGTTSAFAYLYAALYGRDFDFSYAVQATGSWLPRLPTMPRWEDFHPPDTGTTYLGLARNPLARYVSAFKSKITCLVENGDRPRLVPALLELAAHPFTPLTASEDYGGGQCLDFDQYTIALKMVHDAGKVEDLNQHFAPQYFALAQCQGGLYVTADEMTTLVPVLQRTYGLYNVTMPETHVSPENVDYGITARGLKRLCKIAQREMEWFGSALPAEETPYHC